MTQASEICRMNSKLAQQCQQNHFNDLSLRQMLSNNRMSENSYNGVHVKFEDEELVIVEDDTVEHCQTGTSPSFVEFGGKFNFNISIQESFRKDLSYSPLLKKMYVQLLSKFPIDFSMDFVLACQHNLSIRALMVYSKDDSIAEPVRRCLNHTISEEVTDHLVKHVLRSADNKEVQYEEDLKSGRLSVVIPVQPPQPGSITVRELYQCACSHSCSFNGINRRETQIIFTLEERGRVVGRRVLPIRVCSCPKRDLEKEEEKQKSHSDVNGTSTKTNKRKSKWNNSQPMISKTRKKIEESGSSGDESDDDDDDDVYIFTITVKGKKKLRKVAAVFNAGAVEVNVRKKET